MGVFLIGAILTMAALGLLSLPFFRRPAAPDAPRDVNIYRDQLAEIDRDQDRGVLTSDQADAARTEIERRLLVASRRMTAPEEGRSRIGRLAFVAGLALMPLAAGSYYLMHGTPVPPADALARPAPTPAQIAGNERHPELLQQIVALEERLAQSPEDLDGYALLARSYASIGEYDRALRAYDVANRLAMGGDRQLAGEYAEVMVMANGGTVIDPARQIFAQILRNVPDDPQSTYYLALAKAQDGDNEGAAADLLRLRAASPMGAPWIPALDNLLAQIAPGSVPAASPVRQAAPAPGPTPEMMAAAADMSEEDRNAMIEGMVGGLAARLEQSPDDVEGWRRLARAYEVLGRPDDALAAHRQVLRLAPADPVASAFVARAGD